MGREQGSVEGLRAMLLRWSLVTQVGAGRSSPSGEARVTIQPSVSGHCADIVWAPRARWTNVVERPLVQPR